MNEWMNEWTNELTDLLIDWFCWLIDRLLKNNGRIDGLVNWLVYQLNSQPIGQFNCG